jgi:hypothetical protein
MTTCYRCQDRGVYWGYDPDIQDNRDLPCHCSAAEMQADEPLFVPACGRCQGRGWHLGYDAQGDHGRLPCDCLDGQALRQQQAGG